MRGSASKLLGRWGEAAVAADMRKRGFRILASGYQTRFGEIDLIAADDKYLVFTEVKLRKDSRFATGGAAVDRHKQERLRATAEHYLAEHPAHPLQPRFDVVEVYAPEGMHTAQPHIIYIENAF